MLHPQFFARVKMRGDGVEWDAAPTLVSEQHTTALTDHVLPLAGGFRQIGVALYAHPATAGLVTGVWDDYVTLVRLDVTVDDAVPPALSWVDGGGLLDGAWHQGDVCATLAIADGQSGVGSVSLASDGVATGWGAPATGSQYQPGIATAQPSLCLSAATLGDGIHAGSVSGADASGGQATPLPFTVRVDRTPPVAKLVAPGATAPDALPAGRARRGRCHERRLGGRAADRRHGAWRSTSPPAEPPAAPRPPWPTARTRSRGSSSTPPATAQTAARTSTCPTPRRPRSARRSLPNGTVLAAGDVLAVAVAVARRRLRGRSRLRRAAARREPRRARLAGRGSRARRRRRASRGRSRITWCSKLADRAGNAARLAWDVTVAEAPGASAGSAPAGGGSATGGTAATAPGSAGAVARKRVTAAIRAIAARVGATRHRTVVVRLRAQPHLRIALRLHCGHAVRMLKARAGAHGIAIVRVSCPGVATLRLAAPPRRLLVRIAARRLPLHLHVRPQSRSAPTVARVSGKLAELHGHHLVLEALTPERMAARRSCAGRLQGPLRHLLRDRAPGGVRPARAGRRARGRCQPAVRADGALTSEDA